MIPALKRLGKSLFSEFGVEIRKKREPTPARASLKGALYQRSTLRFHPSTVIDVGVASETRGGPQLYDVVSQMKAYRFVVYDIFGFNYRPFDEGLAQVDMVFVREQGYFRQSHVFSTPEKRRQQFSEAQQAQFAAEGG